MRERTSRRHATIPAILLLGALLLALATAERAESALPEEESALSVGDVMLTEGTGGTRDAVFTVTLSAASSETVTVAYATADGAAKAPADYTAASGTLTFAPGETAKTVPVAIEGDALDEPHENFALNLSSASGAALADDQALGTILDDDPAPSLTVSDASATEGGTAFFTVRLSALSGKLVTVDYATSDGSATAPADYAAGSGTLVFSPGEQEETVSVPTAQDSLVEGDETFFVSLSRAVNATLADSQGLGTVRDDDQASDSQDPPGGEDPGSTEDPPNSAPDCSRVRPSTTRLWPPNHKFRLVWLLGATDPDGDALTLAVTGVTQDEPVREKGRGHKAGPDAAWVAGRPHQVKLRAERSGRGDGRVYRLAFTVTDEHGAECSGTALVGVPHDSRKRWVDSGAVFDSFRF